jgi:signal transduction histidine kinase
MRARDAVQHRRLRLGLVLAGLAMLVGLALLIRGALAASAREQELRREALAARVFDELESSLAAFVAGEESRPFVQWRREWLAPVAPSSKSGGTAIALSNSPLASLPEQPFVLGYFQIEPDGQFASPMLPGAGEPVAAPELGERVEQLRELNRDLANDERLALASSSLVELANPEDEPQQRPQQALPEDVKIQRALDQQSIARQRKNVTANQQAFSPDIEQLSNFVGPGNNELLDSVSLGGPAAPGDALDVRVTGFAVEQLGYGDALRMIRTVEIAGQRWIQGVVLDRAALQRWLEQEVLGSPELAGFVDLEWDSTAESDSAAGRWNHQFAAPFSVLEVSAELGRVHVLSSTGARVILALGVGLGLALVLVLFAVERSVAGLRARAEERERFIAAVTHELRTPLTSIRMYSEMLEQGMVADADRQRSYHGTIRGEAERLSRLVEQVLTLARLDERQHSLIGEREQASVEAVVTGVVELLRPLAEARELRVEVALEQAAAATRVPRDALAQIVTNLVDNAIKFSPIAGAPIELTATRRADTLSLRVCDRGPGVAPELLPRMFEAFVRGRREHEQATPGTGIGLAVVEALVVELGGRVRARNRVEGGLEIEVDVALAN